MSVLVSGYPYIRENYFNTLRYYPQKDGLWFLLPKSWPIKGGKVVYHPPEDSRVSSLPAYFYHSHYPVIGGLFKGLMLAFPLWLWQNKKSKDIKIVLTLTEPILLSTLYQAFWTKLFGLKHVLFTWENIEYKEKFTGLNGLVKEMIINANLWLSDGIICGNKKAVEIFKHYTKKPIVNIPFAGIDTQFFSPQREEKIFREHDLQNKTIFSFVGALEYRKGVHHIIDAFRALKASLPDSHLIIAGTGQEEYEKILKDKIQSDSDITVVPWISHDELKHIFAITDVFVYPSLPYKGWEEQLGYLLMEASAAGQAIVSTDSGSISEVVINNQTGLLVPPDESKQLGEAMLRLAQNPELRQRLGQQAREHIIKNFDVRVISQEFFNFFKTIK